MDKMKILKIINPLMAILFLLIFVSALFNESLSADTYRFVHKIPGFLFAICVIIHASLNRAWFESVYSKKR